MNMSSCATGGDFGDHAGSSYDDSYHAAPAASGSRQLTTKQKVAISLASLAAAGVVISLAAFISSTLADK